MDAGFYTITLDSWTPGINPTRIDLPRAEKKIAIITTLTQSVKQHWQKKTSDKFITMEWDWLDKADVDTLITKDEADYTYYSFTTEYNDSFNVIIAECISRRNGTTDSEGFSVSLRLEIIS